MTLAPLVVLTIAFGIFPALILDLTAAPVDEILSIVEGAGEAASATITGLLP
jgi:NADH:ubiquinone oxidoreductase subunit 4 (subunit M)